MIKFSNNKRIEREFELFTKRNFEKPKKCKSLEQIKFYIKELTQIIEQYKLKHDFVPESAYVLLNEYNIQLNKLVMVNFQETYGNL